MSCTPAKEEDINLIKDLTPVRFLISPRGKLCMQDSFTTCKDRLDDIISQQKINYFKWQIAQKKGFAICISIEAIKTRALVSKGSARQLKENEETLYHRDLKPLIEKLNIIVSVFENITKIAGESLRLLIALSKLPDNTDKVFHQSWPLSQYINFLDQLYSSYNKENNIKQRVACELPHCMNRSDLIRCTTAWEYPQYVDEWTYLMFAFLEEEKKNRT